MSQIKSKTKKRFRPKMKVYNGIALEKDLIALKKELLLETHFDNGVTHFQKGIHCFAVFKSQRPVISFTINITFARYRNEFLFEILISHFIFSYRY